MSLPEMLLWRELRLAPHGLRFRKQHAAGDYVIDFFCARVNLAIEVDGLSHDMGERPLRDAERDAWLREHRIDTVRYPAREVLRNVHAVAESIVSIVCERLEHFGKTSPSSLRDATCPSTCDGEDR